MNVRRLAPAGLLIAILAGCGAPTAEKFTDSEITKALHPKAADVTRREVEQRFGTPENLVATLRFSPAIDFGRIEGTVASTDAKLAKHQFAVAWKDGKSYTPEEIRGLGLAFESGGYVSAVYDAPKADPKKGVKKGKNGAFFHVANYKAGNEGTGIISVNFLLKEPPKEGDKIVLVGHRMRNGRRLYMQHCMHCHGYSGDGQGPTAKYLNPRPRDYRLGKFKFTSTNVRSKANRDDLKRILKKGIPGTYMPSFLLTFKEDGLHDVVEYVRWLAMRGEVENRLAKTLYVKGYSRHAWKATQDEATETFEAAHSAWEKGGKSGEEPKKEDFLPETGLNEYVSELLGEDIDTMLEITTGSWVNAEKPNVVVRPDEKRHPATPESIARGRALFLSKDTLCWSCHGVSGRGDGYQTTSFQKNNDPLAISQTRAEPGLYDEWNNKIKPRNLTTGIYRGGRRPIDLYRRVATGIKGTPMAGFKASLDDRQIWDLVNYILSIPLNPDGHAVGKPSGATPGKNVSQK